MSAHPVALVSYGYEEQGGVSQSDYADALRSAVEEVFPGARVVLEQTDDYTNPVSVDLLYRGDELPLDARRRVDHLTCGVGERAWDLACQAEVAS